MLRRTAIPPRDFWLASASSRSFRHKAGKLWRILPGKVLFICQSNSCFLGFSALESSASHWRKEDYYSIFRIRNFLVRQKSVLYCI